MKILLIYPPLKYMIKTEIPQSINQCRGNLPPLGLLYLASYVRLNSNHSIVVIDSQVENLNYKNLRDRIIRVKPDLVGIQANTFSLVDAVKTAEVVKSIDHKTKVVFGGPHIELYPEETLRLRPVDYVVLGEGEKVFLELVNRLDYNGELIDLQSVGYKDNGQILIERTPAVIDNLDELPFPDRTMLPYQKYRYIISKRFPVTTMITSRGCPYGCIFCHESGKKYRAVSPEYVLGEIEECIRLGIKEIFIHDDTFTTDRRRLVSICEQIISRKLKLPWSARARVDTVDKETLFLMKEAGCIRLIFGVESGSQRVLAVLNKGINIDQVYKAFSDAKKAGIITLADFMIGCPGETEGDILKTIELMRKIKPEFVQFSILTPYPGTELYKIGLNNGIIPEDRWIKFARKPCEDFTPYIWVEKISQERLNFLISEAYRKHYINPGFIFKNIMKTRTMEEFIRKLKVMVRLVRL